MSNNIINLTFYFHALYNNEVSFVLHKCHAAKYGTMFSDFKTVFLGDT